MGAATGKQPYFKSKFPLEGREQKNVEVANALFASKPYQDWSGPRMIGLEEKEHEEPVHMTFSLLCRLCSPAGPTVTDSL